MLHELRDGAMGGQRGALLPSDQPGQVVARKEDAAIRIEQLAIKTVVVGGASGLGDRDTQEPRLQGICPQLT